MKARARKIRSLTRSLAFVVASGAALGALTSTTAGAALPLRLALELEPATTVKGDHHAADSLSRQVLVYLTPQLEALGYTVERVHHAREAARSGAYHAAVWIEVDGRPVHVVNEARRYERTVIVDASQGANAWARWKVWGAEKRALGRGRMGPLGSQVHEAGTGGRTMVDDEAAVARLVADRLAKRVAESLAEPEGSDRAARR